MVFELNQDYLGRTWLPGLIHTWVSGAGADFRVRIEPWKSRPTSFTSRSPVP